MDKVLVKILTIFPNIQSFSKMIEGEKYTIEYRERYQFGGSCIEVKRDGLMIKEQINLGDRSWAKCVGYDIIVDDFLSRNGVVYNDDMNNGGLHIQIMMAARGIHFGITPTPEQIKREEEQNAIANIFIENWNKMIDAISKYIK